MRAILSSRILRVLFYISSVTTRPVNADFARPFSNGERSWGTTNACPEVSFYSPIAEYVAGIVELLRSKPRQDPYETRAEFQPRYERWALSTRMALDSLSSRAGEPMALSKILGSHYDPDQERLFIDSIVPVQIPGIIRRGPYELVEYPVVDCRDVGPLFECPATGNAFSQLRISSNSAWLRLARASPRISIPLPRDVARSYDVARAPLQLGAEFRLGYVYYSGELTRSPSFAPTLVLQRVYLMAEQEIVRVVGHWSPEELRQRNQIFSVAPQPVFNENLFAWRPQNPTCPPR
jgi:hypothetical protein